MNLDHIPLLGQLVRRMDFLAARQRVIADNVANADTPGYRPKDIAPSAFARELAGTGSATLAPVTMATTAPGHLAGPRGPGGGGMTPRRADDYEIAPSGNAVVLEEQMARLAEVQMDHATITSLYRKQIGLLRMALGGGNRG